MTAPNTTEVPHPGLPFADALVLSDQVLELYAASKPSRTFGDWVLVTYYPDLHSPNFTIDRDFRHAQRTSDAETYLKALLWKGCLDPTPLQAAVKSL